MSEAPEPVEAQVVPEQQLPKPSKDACTMAMLAHLLLLVPGVGIFGPIIIYLIKKDEDKFIAFHSLQAIYLGLAVLVLVVPTCGLAAIVGLVFNIMLLIKANNGEWAEYPLVGAWAKK